MRDMKDIARALDPILLAKDCGLELDPWQAELLRDRPRRALLNCCRQSGKTTISVLIALYVALYDSPALVMIVSPSQRQSAEAFKSLMTLYGKLDEVPRLRQESVLRAEFENGSRIVALPGSQKTTRGYAGVKLVLIDEAARVENDLIQAVRPTLAVTEGGGTIMALSTPNGAQGWFYEAWMHGGDVWHRVRVPAEACPRISKEFLEEELKQLGPSRFSEEYSLAFVDPESSVWNAAIIDSAFSSELRPLWT